MNDLNFLIAYEDYVKPSLNNATDNQIWLAHFYLSHMEHNNIEINETIDFFSEKDMKIKFIMHCFKTLCTLNKGKNFPFIKNQKIFELFNKIISQGQINLRINWHNQNNFYSSNNGD